MNNFEQDCTPVYIPTPNTYIASKDIPVKGYVCDCWTAGNPGYGGGRAYNLAEKTIVNIGLLQPDHIKNVRNIDTGLVYTARHSNNFWELSSLVKTMQYIEKLNSIDDEVIPIYTDSKTVLAWLNGRMGSKVAEKDLILGLIDTYHRIEYKSFHKYHILKWETGIWGESKADYDRK